MSSFSGSHCTVRPWRSDVLAIWQAMAELKPSANGQLGSLRLESHFVRHADHRSLVSQRKVVSVFAKEIVAKCRIPAEQEILRLVHRDVHRVRNFHARGKIVVARHRDLARYL